MALWTEARLDPSAPPLAHSLLSSVHPALWQPAIVNHSRSTTNCLFITKTYRADGSFNGITVQHYYNVPSSQPSLLFLSLLWTAYVLYSLHIWTICSLDSSHNNKALLNSCLKIMYKKKNSPSCLAKWFQQWPSLVDCVSALSGQHCAIKKNQLHPG